MLIAAISIAALIGTLKYTGISKLEKINLESAELPFEPETLNIAMNQNLFQAPLPDLINSMLSHKKVFRVDIDYRLPDGIGIKINDIKPVALVIGENGRVVYRLSESCHLLPCHAPPMEYDFPVITGLDNCTAYKRVRDERVTLLIKQLKQLKEVSIDFYLAISSIDMSHPERLSVYIDGLTFPVDTYAGNLCPTMEKLRAFLLNFNPDLNDVKRLDLRSDNMIVAVS
jgi:cell division septal protein FtsQ